MITAYQDREVRDLKNFWNNFHFHPTDAIEDDWGRRILDKAALDNAADTVRMYAMLEDIVSIDGSGKLVYDFTLNDQRIDYMIEKGFNLLISYNFIPPCIAENADLQSNVSKNKTRYKGKMIVTSRPKDYALWEEICYEYTKHIVEKYGLETVSKWYLQCFNEPDIKRFFLGDLEDTPENTKIRLKEYLNLYRGFQSAAKRVSEKLKIGGPTAAGCYIEVFFDGFLKAVKEENLKMDYICFHTYGTTPALLNSGERLFHAENTLRLHNEYINIVKKYFKQGEKELVVDEWGASCSGFYNKEECPALMFREGAEFAAYMGKMVSAYIRDDTWVDKMFICLSGQHEMTEDFSGFRNFFTLNFITKPIYNAYVMMRKIRTKLTKCDCDVENMSAFSTRDENGGAVLMAYAAENFDKKLDTVTDTVKINGVFGKCKMTVWCIDDLHTNPYGLYLRNGYTDVTDENLEILRNEGNMKPIFEGEVTAEGSIEYKVAINNNSLMLIEYEMI